MGPPMVIWSFKVRTSCQSTFLAIKFWQYFHLAFPLLVRDGDSSWIGSNLNAELFQLRLCWHVGGRSPWIPGCGQKRAPEGFPGWCTQVTLTDVGQPTPPGVRGWRAVIPCLSDSGSSPSLPFWTTTYPYPEAFGSRCVVCGLRLLLPIACFSAH